MRTRSVERTQFLTTILTTAVEGGINYWADTKDYAWQFEEGMAAWAHVNVRESNEGDEPGPWRTVTIDTIAHGLSVIKKRSDIPYLGTHVRKLIIGADYTLDEDGEIDADLADVIVQVALFGEVRYA